MTRGEVYYIKSHKLENGCAQTPDRPAVIVSNDMLNALSSFVKVCYMTAKPVDDMPTHVTTRSTGCVSTILCESLNNVHVSNFVTKAGELTEAEMQAVDAALAISLGLDFGVVDRPVEKIVEKIVMREPTEKELDVLLDKRLKDMLEDVHMQILPEKPVAQNDALIRAETERDVYRDLYHNLLNKLLGDAE